VSNPRIEYLLQELRCASIRARLWAGDIDAVGLALKASLITPEQAIEILEDCPALQFEALGWSIAAADHRKDWS
jgi:hypothetical protein